jgi:hypothetical protein
MLTRIRTTIATLATAFTVLVAIGALAPAAQATKNDGRYQSSAEAHKKACSDLLELYNDNKEIRDDTKNSKKERHDAAVGVGKAYQDANKIGCGWASGNVA